MTRSTSAYGRSGVDIDAKYDAVRGAQAAIRATFTPGVKSDIGLFGGVFDLRAAGVEGQLLVASTDGVGTKVKIASAAGRLGTIGADLVNHCVDDILVQGARPLFFLDYIAVDRMEPASVREVIEGIASACKANGCALIGGETAEMPGVYRPGEMDIAGTIVGSVERDRLLEGDRIRPGDVVLALPSSGLHTNGYSLARRILLDEAGLDLDARPDRLRGESVADALLAVHRSYLDCIWPLLEAGLIHGMAHITGGGLYDNVPRVLPADCGVVVDAGSMPRPPIFDLIVELGRLDRREAYRVLNMGFGMLLFVPAADASKVESMVGDLGEAVYRVGEVVPGSRSVEIR